MKKVLYTHLLILLPISLFIGFLMEPNAGISFGLGSILALTNFLVLFWFVRRVFAKKQVALSSLVIVFKYLILGLIIYFVLTRTELPTIWFGVGLISLLLAVVPNFKYLELDLEASMKQ
jgi:hypothetical protein